MCRGQAEKDNDDVAMCRDRRVIVVKGCGPGVVS